MNLIITTCDDTLHYVEQLGVFLRSMKNNAPRERVVCYLIGDPKLEEREFDNARFVRPEWKFNSSDKKGIMVCLRTMAMLDNFDKCANMAWMDTDVIVRKPIDGLWDMDGDTIHITYRPDKKEKRKFQAGIFSITCTEKTKKMLEWWNAEVWKDCSWYRDQLCLYQAWEKFRKTVRLKKMALRLNDDVFGSESEIWHCKQIGFSNPRYQKEYHKWLVK